MAIFHFHDITPYKIKLSRHDCEKCGDCALFPLQNITLRKERKMLLEKTKIRYSNIVM